MNQSLFVQIPVIEVKNNQLLFKRDEINELYEPILSICGGINREERMVDSYIHQMTPEHTSFPFWAMSAIAYLCRKEEWTPVDHDIYQLSQLMCQDFLNHKDGVFE